MEDSYLYALIAVLVVLIIGLAYYFMYWRPAHMQKVAKKVARKAKHIV